MNDSIAAAPRPNSPELGPLRASASSASSVKFSVITGVTDKSPAVFDLPWQEFADTLLQYDFRTDKLAGPLFSPAELVGGRETSNVQAVHFGVLDLDGELVPGPNGKKVHGGVPSGEFLELLKLAERYDSFAYTTWSQPFASTRNALCARLVVPWSRPVLPSEFAAVRARFVAEFGGKSDPKTDDMTRVLFTPSLPVGSEWAVSVWRADDWQGGARTWDVDAALAAGPVEIAKTIVVDARDPIPRAAVVRLAAKLEKSDDSQKLRIGQMMRAGLDGHRLAEPGSRRDAIRDLTWRLAQAFPSGSADSMLDYFKLSLQFMSAEGADSDPCGQFIKLLQDAQRKIAENEHAKRLERANDRRRVIDLSWRIETVSDAAIEELAALDVFQRSGGLVHVTRDAVPDKIVRPAGAPSIRDLPRSRLRELLDRRIRFEGKRDGVPVTVPPPFDTVNAIAERGEWQHVRPLRGIVNFPVLRPDGTLLESAGYDLTTATLSNNTIRLTVPDAPTLADAQQAAAKLLELVSDFPFADDAARAVWLAALLTPLARTAIDGPVPLTIFDANARGAGKTLLASIIGRIVLGADLSTRTAPETQEEWRKSIFAIVLAGDPLVLIDNVTRMVQSAALDAVLTSTTYGDRVLGLSQERTIPVRTSFMLSSNNARLSSDLVRRSLHCRLESENERPEQRGDFRYPHVLGHATEHRAEYLTVSGHPKRRVAGQQGARAQKRAGTTARFTRPAKAENWA